MKNIKTIILTIVAAFAMYLAGAFANASFYIDKWGSLSREMCAVWGSILIGIGIIVFAVQEHEDKQK